MENIIRILVPLDSQDQVTFQTALGYARAICENENVSEMILLTHTKNQLEHTSLSSALGSGVVCALRKGAVSLPWNAQLHAETMRTMHRPTKRCVIIVYYAEPSILDFVDGLQNISGVIAIPGLPGEANDWVNRWGAVVHGQERQKPAPLIDDPIVVRALETLTQIVDLSTGLTHPRDKDHADAILRILRAKGHADPSPNIKSWAIRNGWRPKDGALLEVLSRKIWNLKRKPSLSKIYNAEERYQRWHDG